VVKDIDYAKLYRKECRIRKVQEARLCKINKIVAAGFLPAALKLLMLTLVLRKV
jgi:hypothetical protein